MAKKRKAKGNNILKILGIAGVFLLGYKFLSKDETPPPPVIRKRVPGQVGPVVNDKVNTGNTGAGSGGPGAASMEGCY